MAAIFFDPEGDFDTFSELFGKAAADHRSVIILACDANGIEKERVDPLLQRSGVPVIGGIFPAIIHDTAKHERGTILIGLDEPLDVHIVERISQKEYEQIDREVEAEIDSFDPSVRTIFVFIDGLAGNIGECVGVLFDNYGLDINYIGGGSGSLSFRRSPSLFTNRGLLQDACVYAYSPLPSAIGVSHGWKRIDGPYQVTRSSATVIHELDYLPAFDLYKRVVDRYAPRPLDAENFFDTAKSFPFGLNTISDEKIVRDPIMLDGSSIVCVGDVEEGSYVDILQGEPERLIEAAGRAAQISRANALFETEFILFIDCISRVLFLENAFAREIEAVHTGEVPLVGALTFGEIANNGRDFLEFYNKTSVVGRIGHG